MNRCAFKDLTGKQFGYWTVVKRVENDKNNQTRWLCRCKCGTERIVNGASLKRGDSKSCGCYNLEQNKKRIIDITGQKFGKLTALKIVGYTSARNALWLCKCECGNEDIVNGSALRHGRIKSCGCLIGETNKKRTVHGLYKHKLYKVWAGMKDRCYNSNIPNYKKYGARGITVCDEWLSGIKPFYDWAMANGYQEGLSIDRIDNNGNYEPSNCRWTTAKVQANNRRNNRRDK